MLGVFAFIASCADPHMELTGSVHEANGTPVSGATVLTECPPANDTYGDLSTETATNGSFSVEGLGSVNRDCSLEVIVPVSPARVYRYRALDFCVDHDEVSCTELNARITLP